MGSWFSSEPEVQAKEAITQTGNAAVQFNWAIFSTGISSLAIVIVLLVLLYICYRKNQRANRRARRAELHDIVHSLHRSTPGPEPMRMGYPQYPPSVANYVPPPAATAIPMVAYPSAPPTASAPRAVTYTSAAGIRADAPGMPGVNSGLRRQPSLRAPNKEVAPNAKAPKPIPGSPIFPSVRLTSIREGPSASIARPRPKATEVPKATAVIKPIAVPKATEAPRATAAPHALTYEPQQSKSLYDLYLFPGHFPTSNAFPSLATPQLGDTFASDRFTEL